jgi:proline iminopeptidase
VGDGNRVYWEVCGNPRGKPAVMLHGGPGSRSNPDFRRYFDPAAYRIVLLDQRGCGRSTPSASAYDTDMSVNTTAHVIADLERLRRHLEIERWLVWGVSWGSALGLRYTQTHPGAVSELVLTAVATGANREVSLMTRGLGQSASRPGDPVILRTRCDPAPATPLVRRSHVRLRGRNRGLRLDSVPQQ